MVSPKAHHLSLFIGSTAVILSMYAHDNDKCRGGVGDQYAATKARAYRRHSEVCRLRQRYHTCSCTRPSFQCITGMSYHNWRCMTYTDITVFATCSRKCESINRARHGDEVARGTTHVSLTSIMIEGMLSSGSIYNLSASSCQGYAS